MSTNLVFVLMGFTNLVRVTFICPCAYCIYELAYWNNASLVCIGSQEYTQTILTLRTQQPNLEDIKARGVIRRTLARSDAY